MATNYQKFTRSNDPESWDDYLDYLAYEDMTEDEFSFEDYQTYLREQHEDNLVSQYEYLRDEGLI